ncbi:MAG: type II secretion system protein [Marinibacterium sp.]
MTRRDAARTAQAGVTLVEMLVVLALFAIVAGAVVLALPKPQEDGGDFAALTLSARLDRAVDRALTRNQGFAVWSDAGKVVVLDPGKSGGWTVVADPFLNPVKLVAGLDRMSFQRDDRAVYAVSPALIPLTGGVLRIPLGTSREAPELVFDGLGTALQTSQEERHGTRTR